MSQKPIDDYPESAAVELSNMALQTGLGLVPVIGGAAAPIVAALVYGPLEKRRAAWFNRIGEGIREVEQRFSGFDPETLADNEDFVSAVYSTTDAAMRSSSDAKRARLANVVLNIAVGRSIADALRQRFLDLLQLFSEEHILLLRIGQNPKSFSRVEQRVQSMTAGSRGGVYLEELAHHGVSDAIFRIIAADLEREQFIQGGFNVTMSAQGILDPIITERGAAFLQFISSPLED